MASFEVGFGVDYGEFVSNIVAAAHEARIL